MSDAAMSGWGASKRLLGVCIGLIVLTSAAAAQRSLPVATDNPLVGTWEHTQEYGGVGTTSILVFFADGSFSHVVKATTVSRYRLTGNVVVVSPSTGPPMETTISIAGDTLIKVTAGVIQKLGRDPRSRGAVGLVGQWNGRNAYGADITETFTSDGIFRQESTIGGEVGRYEIAGEKIVWNVLLPKKSKRTTGFTRPGNMLRLLPPGESVPGDYTKVR
jgi:hypothetical protein